MIQGNGLQNAPVMLIADGGTTEDAGTNYAISGYSLTLLKQLMPRSQHYDLSNTYRTCFIKEKVNLTDFDSYKEKAIGQYSSILEAEIREIGPNLIIPMGELSFRYVSGIENIRKYRGSVLPSDGTKGFKFNTKVLPILGPQPYLLQEYKQRWVTQIDLGKIHKYTADEPIPDSQYTLWIARSSGSLRAFFERQDWSENGFLIFDIETFAGIPGCISFSFDGRESVTVPILDKDIDRDVRSLMLQLVAKVLNSDIHKGNQNIKYDYRINVRHGLNVVNIVADTQLAATLLTPELPKNLGFLISVYTDLPYHKDEGKEHNPEGVKNKDKYYLYCAKDSLGTYQVHQAQMQELQETGQMAVYEQLVKLIPIYKKMEDNGLRIDHEGAAALTAKYESLFNIQVLKLKTLVNHQEVNPLSSVQMNKLVYDELGFSKSRYANNTEQEALEYLMVYGTAMKSPVYGKEILQIIINCRRIHKVLEFLDTTLYPDGRLRCEYRLGGTVTGRTSAGETIDQFISWNGKKYVFENLGKSFQTIGKHGFWMDGVEYGKDIRKIIIPSVGYSFVEIDLSQAEARVDTVLAGNFDLLTVFDGPIGIHRLTGSWVYSCKPEEIKKGTDKYHMSKIVRHAGERNMKVDRLVMMTAQPLSDCKRILDTFHKFQPEIREVFHRDIIKCMERTSPGLLISPNGRRRQFLGRPDAHQINEAISQLPQSIVSDQTKFSLIPTMQSCGDFVRLVNEAHDGTLAEVKKGRELEYAEIYKKNIETGIDFRPCSLSRDYCLTIPSEVSVSEESWYDVKEVKL